MHWIMYEDSIILRCKLFTNHCLGMSEIPLSMVPSSFYHVPAFSHTGTFLLSGPPNCCTPYISGLCHHCMPLSLSHKLRILITNTKLSFFHVQYLFTLGHVLSFRFCRNLCIFSSWYF